MADTKSQPRAEDGDKIKQLEPGTYRIPAGSTITWLKTLASKAIVFRVETHKGGG